jgi:hypothetical protein
MTIRHSSTATRFCLLACSAVGSSRRSASSRSTTSSQRFTRHIFTSKQFLPDVPTDPFRLLHHHSPFLPLQTNLANPETVATCATRKAASIKKHAAAAAAAAAPSATVDLKPKYVDRAAARREALGQNDEDHGGGKGKKKFAAPVKEPSPDPPNQDGLEVSNAGRKMLEKMVRSCSLFLFSARF